MKNLNYKLSLIFELVCFGFLVFLELQYHMNLATVIFPLGLLVMCLLLTSLAQDFHGIPRKLCLVLALLIYPFSFYFFSQLGLPKATPYHLLIFFLIRSFMGVWLHFYDELRRLPLFQSREWLVMVLVSAYVGLMASLIQVQSINLYESLRTLSLPRVYPFNLTLFLIDSAIHLAFVLSMRALRQFQK